MILVTGLNNDRTRREESHGKNESRTAIKESALKESHFLTSEKSKPYQLGAEENYPALSASLVVITFSLTDGRIFRDVFNELCKTLCSVALSSKDFLLELEFTVGKGMARRQC